MDLAAEANLLVVEIGMLWWSVTLVAFEGKPGVLLI